MQTLIIRKEEKMQQLTTGQKIEDIPKWTEKFIGIKN